MVRTLELSHSSDLLLPLRWISILHGKVDVDLALTSGIHTAEDILKAMMAGARVAMSASMILHDGYDKISSVLEELENWMEEHEYDSIKQMQGSMSQQSVAEPAAFERSNYIRILNSYRDLP